MLHHGNFILRNRGSNNIWVCLSIREDISDQYLQKTLESLWQSLLTKETCVNIHKAHQNKDIAQYF